MITKTELKMSTGVFYAFLQAYDAVHSFIEAANKKDPRVAVKQLIGNVGICVFDDFVRWFGGERSASFWRDLDEKWCSFHMSESFKIAVCMCMHEPQFFAFLTRKGLLLRYCDLFCTDEDYDSWEDMYERCSQSSYITLAFEWPDAECMEWSKASKEWQEEV